MTATPNTTDAMAPSDANPDQVPDQAPATKISDAEAKLLREVMALKGKVKDRDAALARFDGIDPDELRSSITAESRKTIAERDASITALHAQLDELTISAAFNSSAFIRDRTSLPVDKAVSCIAPISTTRAADPLSMMPSVAPMVRGFPSWAEMQSLCRSIAVLSG